MEDRAMSLRTAIVVSFSVVNASCATTSRIEQDAPGVRAAIDQFRTAVNAGDTIAFFRILTADFEVFPPGSAPLRGAAAQDLFRGLFRTSAVTLPPFTNEEIEVNGNLAVQRYSFEFIVRPKAGGAQSTQKGSGLHIWRRTGDGQWRLAKDIWTNPPGN